MTLALIAAGGLIGAYARYALSGWVHARAGARFPWGTLVVNGLGSLLLGIALAWLGAPGGEERAAHALLVIGGLGGFTTFSTFAYEVASLVEEGDRWRAGVYVGATLALGLLGVAGGFGLGRIVS